MMRTPPQPISHNFYHPAPENNVYDYQCMLPQDQLREWKRNQQQQQVSQPPQTHSSYYPTVSSSSSSYIPAHSGVYSDSAYTTAPTISLQHPATPDLTPVTASRRTTPISSPQMAGGMDWALYPEASYRSSFSSAPRESGLKVETSGDYLAAPLQTEHVSMAIPPQSRIRNLRPSYEELPPLSAASSRRSVSESGTYSPLTPSTSPNPEADRASGINLPNSLSTQDSQYSSDMYARGPRHQHQSFHTDVPELFNRAQNQHSEDRIHSAFKSSSPYRRTTPRSPSKQLLVPLAYASHQRERRAEEDAQHAVRTNDRIQSTPKTISPKDAYLEYHASEDQAGKVSLFGRDESIPAENGMSNHGIHQSNDHSGSYNDFMGGFDAPKIDFSQHLDPYHEPVVTGVPEYDYHSMDHHQNQSTSSPTMRTGSLSGPYPCSLPGCIQRFQTPAKLQKHKREFHRQITPQASAHGGMTSNAHIPKSHQPGPHQCLRINPTTGKPCNTIFSRPYDLTRHEDTIHNTNREKARCEICNDEKTFSRQDALTRHKKVKHGIDK